MQTIDLTLGYDHRTVVESVSLELPDGAVTAIVGPNGSGKSTLLRGMSGLLQPRGGVVRIDGEDIGALGRTALARRLAVLPQATLTPDGLTVGDLVSRGRHPHRAWYQRWNAADETAVRDAVAQVGLLDRMADQVAALSGGQRQRAWLAMVLAQETRHLLLDEPTTYLDLAHAVEGITGVRLGDQRSLRTVACVLHYLTLAARFADQVVVLSAGRVVAAGEPADVLTEDLLADVFELKARVFDVDGAPAVVPTRHS